MAKFTQHKDIQDILLSTGNAILVEHTTNDNYWADGGDGTGKNMLGQILVKVRTAIAKSLKDESASESGEGYPVKKAKIQNTVVDLRKLQPQKFDYFLVLDFEATCDENVKLYPQEIIEFPTVLLNAKTLQVEDEFHMYVKPTANPKLTAFCTQLTGIQQEWVEKGTIITSVLEQYDKWISSKKLKANSFTFVTCGDWDLKTCLPSQSKAQSLKRASYFNSWVNIKKLYADFYHRRIGDMVKMLEGLHIKLEGRHHSGIDDCRNITKILVRMLQDGAIVETNGSLRG